MHSPGATGKEEHDSRRTPTLFKRVFRQSFSWSSDLGSGGRYGRVQPFWEATLHHHTGRICIWYSIVMRFTHIRSAGTKTTSGRTIFRAIPFELHGLAHMSLPRGLATTEQYHADWYRHRGGAAGFYTNEPHGIPKSSCRAADGISYHGKLWDI